MSWQKSETGSTKTEEFRELGELSNYHAYGETMDDLHFSPELLFNAMLPFTDPFEFLHTVDELNMLRKGFLNDMQETESVLPERQNLQVEFFNFKIQHGVVMYLEYSAIRLREKPLIWLMHFCLNGKTVLFWLMYKPQYQKSQGAEKLCIKFSRGDHAAAGINNLAPDGVQFIMPLILSLIIN